MLVVVASPAWACRSTRPTNLEQAARADLVVIGRITNYRIVRHDVAEHARFTIRVDALLRGRAGRSFAATWDNSTFAMPATMPRGRYLIALRNSPFEPRGLTVVQEPCAPALMFEEGSEQARAVRAILRRAGR